MAGVFLFIMWMRNVIVFHRINAERGVHFAVLTLKDMGLVNQLVFANQATQWTKSFLFPKDAELRTSIQRYRRTDSISRRRLFAMPSSAPTTWIVVIYTLLYLASFVFGYFNFGAVRFDGQSLMVLVLAMFAVAVAVVAVNGQWFARRVSFASELCRPTRRREFVDDVFSAAGLAVARPVVAICLIQVLFGAFSVSGLVNGLLSGVSVGVLLIGLAVLLYSLSMWGLTVEQDWMLVVITAGAFFGILAVVPFVSVLSYALGGKGMTLHPAAPAVVGLPLFLIGCVICALARSRWNRFEFARLV